jgi:hypothetical protein
MAKGAAVELAGNLPPKERKTTPLFSLRRRNFLPV